MKQIVNRIQLIIVSTVLCFGLTYCKSPQGGKEGVNTAEASGDTTASATVKDTAATETSAAENMPDSTEVLTGADAKAAISSGKKGVAKVAKQVPLTLIVQNLKSPTAPVSVGVYGVKNKFPDPKGQLKVYRFTPKGNTLTANITDLKYGTYALAIYQDINSSGKIDKNGIGIPTEGYAFSNNYRPTIKAPAFKDCKFPYTATQHTVTMKMIQ